MALTPDFSASQPAGQPSVITLTDTSTGSDGTIAARRVYLLNSLGEYVVPDGTSTDYVVWDYAENSIDIDCLTQDAALSITVNWVDSGGAIVETKNILCGFTEYNEEFYYQLTQGQVGSNIQYDTTYYQNKMQLRVLIDSGNQAITLGDDIYSAQDCYDQATYLRLNGNFYY